MNILLVKNDICRFGEMTKEKRTWGGFDVTALMFVNLAKAYPQHNFYVYASNDADKHYNLPNNLINLFGMVKKNISKRKHFRYGTTFYHYDDVCQFLENNNISFDKAIVWYCRPTTFAEFDKGYLSLRTMEPRIMVMSEVHTTAPFVIIKRYNIPSIYIMDDLMELNHITKDVPQPIAIYSQFNSIDKSKYHPTLYTEITRETPVIYKQIEKLWLQGKEKVDWRNFNKTNKFILTVNPGPKKLEYLKKWIFDFNPETVVYGNWSGNAKYKEDIKNLGIDIDKTFKNVPMTDMEDLMFDTRYTLIVPAQPYNKHKEFTAFLTQKVYSMTYYGILPFWCKCDYDTSNIYSEFPDFLKVNTPEEFYEKMNILDNNKDLYNDIKNKLYSLLDDKYFSLNFIHEIYDDYLNE